MKDTTLIAGAWILIATLMLIYSFLQGAIGVETFTLDELKQETRNQQAINYDLRNEILTAQSLTEINKKAREMGFEDARYIFIK